MEHEKATIQVPPFASLTAVLHFCRGLHLVGSIKSARRRGLESFERKSATSDCMTRFAGFFCIKQQHCRSSATGTAPLSLAGNVRSSLVRDAMMTICLRMFVLVDDQYTNTICTPVAGFFVVYTHMVIVDPITVIKGLVQYPQVRKHNLSL